MNTNAYKTNRTFYKNTGFEKRDNNSGHITRFYKNSEKDRLFITPSMSGNSANQDDAVASVIKLFRGTLVTLEAGSLQCHYRELFP
jgi:hypothetical protein